jgi:hypothetical protein
MPGQERKEGKQVSTSINNKERIVRMTQFFQASAGIMSSLDYYRLHCKSLPVRCSPVILPDRCLFKEVDIAIK